MKRAKAAKFSDTSSMPRSRSCSRPRATRNSVRPFGVSEVERVQAQLTPERQGPLADAESRDVQAARFGEAAQLSEQLRDRLVRSDRITGDEEDARLDAVAEERLPVRAEEVVLVAPELEVGKRVGAVPADELPGRVPRLAGRE